MASEAVPVSVVIPAYRRPAMVERAVRSVLRQRLRPSEVIVVDDASGDSTGAAAARLGARVITHEQNLGEGGARNTGIDAAEHEWIALLDSDDEWLPEHLETLWPERDSHVLAGTVVVSAGAGPDAGRVFGWTGRRPRLLRGPTDVAIPENKLVPSSVILRRSTALAVGGFRRGMPRAADLDMWVRLLERGTGVAVPKVTVLYHVHPGQVSADARPMWEAHRAVLGRYSDRPWCRRAIQRHEGVVAWDETRAALAAGEPRGRTLTRFARHVASPQRAIGAAQLLAGRARARRFAGRLAR
jgi:glycosyltransferase involved in cell wall biosynthesis